MIQKILTYPCRRCGSTNLVKNGHNQAGSQQAHCHDCGAYFVLEPKEHPGGASRHTLFQTALERCSLRGLARIFQVTRQTIAKWIEERIQGRPPFRTTILPAQANDVLELDEAWSFVKTKQQQRWLWTVMCRRPRQSIAYVIGDHSDATCKRLWQRVPAEYRRCHSYSDFWQAYQRVLPSQTHQRVGKETGETAHMDRWYNTLRQRIARDVRET